MPDVVERASATFDQTDKFDPPASGYVRVYTFAQYWILTFASLWMLQVEKTLPRAFVLLVFGWMCFSLFVQGAALEGRADARRLEWLRVGVTLALAVVTYLTWPQALANVALVIAGYAAVSAVAFVFGTHNHDNDRNAARAFG
ncbi:MAG: hypothetical protein ACREXP_20135 [Steroidobacteraceae bacterium]